jgi:hypothetical protein
MDTQDVQARLWFLGGSTRVLVPGAVSSSAISGMQFDDVAAHATPLHVHDGKVVGDKGGPYRDQLYDSRPRRTIQVASALSEAELLDVICEMPRRCSGGGCSPTCSTRSSRAARSRAG